MFDKGFVHIHSSLVFDRIYNLVATQVVFLKVLTLLLMFLDQLLSLLSL